MKNDEKKNSAQEKKDNSRGRVYHVSERKEDDKWAVKGEGDARAVKLFDTQAEAIDYARTLADNQDGRIVIHKRDGTIRKLRYD